MGGNRNPELDPDRDPDLEPQPYANDPDAADEDTSQTPEPDEPE